MSAPHYPFDRVQSVGSLRHPLGMEPISLMRLARRASGLYFVAKVQEKADGSKRVLYDTREPLKTILHRINENFLRRVQYPDYLTGGLPGKDYTDSVKLHTGAKTVITEDIAKFYPSVTFDVVKDIWVNFFGFADDVADLLSMLTTRDGHLEQGAPTSSYLANLALWDVEPQMIGKLAHIGITNYSRHVDDITMSCPHNLSASQVNWIFRMVASTLALKGLLIHSGKHEAMYANGQIKILKLLGNTKPSLPPAERSRVRALVHTFCQRVYAGDGLNELEQQLPRIRGQAYKVKRFHSHKGTQLVLQVDQAAKVLLSRLAGDCPLNHPGK